MSNLLNKFKAPFTIYWIATLVLFLYLDYFNIFEMIPQGIHFMRQTDSLSVIIHYMKTGMHFWEPGILNLESHNGKTASEFPIFYYGFAALFNLIGNHPSLVRIFNTLIVFTGYFFIYKTLIHTTQNKFLSIVSTFVLSGSMVVFYYANNFLPDATSLGITFIGIYYCYKYLPNQNNPSDAYKALTLLLLASLVKVSFFIYPTAFILTLFYYQLIIQKKDIMTIGKQFNKPYLLYFVSTLLVIGWVLYVKHYNEVNNGYFLVKSKSFWVADNEDRFWVMKNVTEWWADSYYPIFTQHILAVIFLIGFTQFKKQHSTWFIYSLISLLGGVAFFLLFFLQFREHDYYFLALVPAITIAIINSISSIYRSIKEDPSSLIIGSVVVIVAYTGWISKNTYTRYHSYYPLLIVLVLGIGFLSIKNKKLIYLLLLISTSLVSFIILKHLFDWQQIQLPIKLIAPIIGVLITGIAYKLKNDTPILNYLLITICLYGTISGTAYSKAKLWKRYEESRFDWYSKIGQQLNGYDKVFDDAKISRDAKLIMVIDKNINGGLYFTQRFGWSMLDTSERYLKAIPQCLRDGATHFVLFDTNFAKIPRIESHIQQQIFEDSIIHIYTIKK